MHEFARIDINPDAEHALFASRAQGFARAGYGHHEIVRRAQRARCRIGFHGTKKHQFLADKARSNGDPMI